MGDLKKGTILKIDSDKSWIFSSGKIYSANIKKSLLRKHQPAVGDRVKFEITNKLEKLGLILEVEARINLLSKPRIANIDQVIIVSALKEPNFNSYLLNKYLIFLNFLKIKPILLFTKTDLIKNGQDKNLLRKVQVYREMGYQTLNLSNKVINERDLTALQQILKDKTSVFAGQTGVGKSTTLNRLLKSGPLIKTQEISQALRRGKHTTTSVQLYALSPTSLVADTPGFGNFEVKETKISDLIQELPLLRPYLQDCKFPDCTHLLEETCSLKRHNVFPSEAQFIYEDYCRIINEIKSKRGKTYGKIHHHP